MKRGREYRDFQECLTLQFYRHAFNVPRPLNLDLHTQCYALSVSYLDEDDDKRRDGKDTYNVIYSVFASCVEQFTHEPVIHLASHLKECVFIREVWAFLRKRLGQDVATVIVDLAYKPNRERLLEIAETLMRNDCGSMKRTGCIRYHSDAFPWGRKLLKRFQRG